MSDLESGLKEAVESARGNIVRSPSQPGKYGRTLPNFNGAEQRVMPNMTAPVVIETILELTKQAHGIDALMYELSDALAGGSDSPQVNMTSNNEPAMSVFDRMGIALLDLTRTLESVERNVKRGLGAVKP